MQTIKKDELFHNLGDFLKSKGIELSDGTYTTRIQKGCNLLSDVINGTQKTVRDTKAQVDQAMDKLRESIHKSTAPKPPPAASAPPKARKAPTPRAKRPSRASKSSRPKKG